MKRWLAVIFVVGMGSLLTATAARAQNPLDVLSNPGLSYGYPYPYGYYAAPYAYGYPPYYYGYGYPVHYGPYVWGTPYKNDYQRRLYEQQGERVGEPAHDVHYHYHYHFAR